MKGTPFYSLRRVLLIKRGICEKEIDDNHEWDEQGFI